MKSRILITGGSGFIGTNFVNNLLKNSNFEILNIDITAPILKTQLPFWVNCNILDKAELKKIIIDFEPQNVVHLAAETDTTSKILEDYKTNIQGTKNLICICNEVKSLKKIIITSTQYVYRDKLNPYPRNDITYKPHTTYGISKMISEKMTWDKCSKDFVIVRPTNIWGPYNSNYANGLFKMIKKGLFVLPRNSKSIKSYGYVKNICFQIRNILDDPESKRCVYYLGELPINANYWSTEISKELVGRPPLTIPRTFLFLAAIIGTILNTLKIKFPFYLIRYKNMIEDYDVPIKKTLSKFELRYKDLNENIKETIKWYEERYED